MFKPTLVDGVPEISPEELRDAPAEKIALIDVRRLEEFDGELSHIPGAKLVTLGPELDAFLGAQDKGTPIVFICRSGARSARATAQSISLGFSKTVNLQGGMLLWNEKKYPVKGAQR